MHTLPAVVVEQVAQDLAQTTMYTVEGLLMAALVLQTISWAILYIGAVAVEAVVTMATIVQHLQVVLAEVAGVIFIINMADLVEYHQPDYMMAQAAALH
jgi:hypothetical protein